MSFGKGGSGGLGCREGELQDQLVTIHEIAERHHWVVRPHPHLRGALSPGPGTARPGGENNYWYPDSSEAWLREHPPKQRRRGGYRGRRSG